MRREPVSEHPLIKESGPAPFGSLPPFQTVGPVTQLSRESEGSGTSISLVPTGPAMQPRSSSFLAKTKLALAAFS